MGEFSGRDNDKVMDIKDMITPKEKLDEETVFGIFGGFVKDMANLAMFTKEINGWIKKEAEKVKKKKGTLSKDEYIMAMADILGDAMSKVNKSKLSDELKKSFIQGMEKRFQEIKKGA